MSTLSNCLLKNRTNENVPWHSASENWYPEENIFQNNKLEKNKNIRLAVNQESILNFFFKRLNIIQKRQVCLIALSLPRKAYE